jgi:hypothetical protein
VYHKTSKAGFYGLLALVSPEDNDSNGLPFYTCVHQKSKTLESEKSTETFSLPGTIEAICGTANEGLKADAIVNSQDSVSVQGADLSLRGSRWFLRVADPLAAPAFDTTTTKNSTTGADTWQIEAISTFKLGPGIGMYTVLVDTSCHQFLREFCIS